MTDQPFTGPLARSDLNGLHGATRFRAVDVSCDVRISSCCPWTLGKWSARSGPKQFCQGWFETDRQLFVTHSANRNPDDRHTQVDRIRSRLVANSRQ